MIEMNSQRAPEITDTIRQLVFGIAGDHMGLPYVTLADSDRIREDLGADSLDTLELLMTVEELLDVRIPGISTNSIVTLRDIVDAVVATGPSIEKIEAARRNLRLITTALGSAKEES